MKIVQLTAENVKRISAVTITPKGAMTVIGGDHGAGKSTALDSIMYALGGKKFLPPKPLREGAEAGKIEVKLDGDEARGLRPMTVTRTFAANGRTELKITTADGFAAPSPQAILSDLFNEHTFDPLAFTRLPPKQQAEQLRALVGLDFAELDRQRKTLFDDRTTINREAKSLDAGTGIITYPADTPDESISVDALTREHQRGQSLKDAHTAEIHKLETHQAKNREYWSDVKEQEARIASLEAQLSDARGSLSMVQGKAVYDDRALDEHRALVDRLQREAQEANPDEVLEQIRRADRTNANVRGKKRAAELRLQLAEKQGEADRLTALIEQIDAGKAAQLQAAQWPVEGLGFDDTGVTFKGLPIQQINTAELIRISVAIGFALNPGLPTLLIRDGSLMTLERLQLIGELAEEYGGQLFVERVGDGAECSVIIEDGHVRQ